MDLAEFLLNFGDKIKDKRCLYVLSARMEKKSVIKFGIARKNAYQRLKDYENTYGKTTKLNDCQGVHIFYCGITNFNPNIEFTNTEVYRVERAIKQQFKSQILKDRGEERVTADIKDLLKFIECYETSDRVKSKGKREDIQKRHSERQKAMKDKKNKD